MIHLNKILFISGTLLTVTLVYDFYLTKKSKLYTYEEVAKHNKQNDAWVTYKDTVYDISKFIENHPGGTDKIMLSVGKDIDKYWDIYQQHTNNPDIFNDILKPMEIGKLKVYEKKDQTDLYLNDPPRDSNLKFHNVSPCNAETINIMDNWITPNELWYIRNHHPVPNITDYELDIIDLDNNKISLSLDTIKKKKYKKVTSTMQCGGNRRKEFNKYGKTSGTPWGYGAISTAQWKGMDLQYLLSSIKDKRVKHIQFESIDGVKTSIPINKVLDPNGDVILAYEMNGEELPKDHGYPIRVIIPGYVGIRNLKWVKSIKLSDKEVEGPWQTGLSYKMLPPYIKDVKDIDLTKIPTMQEMPVQSCIVDYKIKDDKIIIKGFALSGGGRNIIRVDVSINNGKTWNLANLCKGSEQEINKAWAWTFWEIELDNRYVNNICCKAIDNAYNTQPEKPEQIWNMRGLNNNSWHKIKINLTKKTIPNWLFK